MDASRFDTVSKFMATRRLSRRQALSQGGAGLAAGALAATGLSAVATAQEATPPATMPLEELEPLQKMTLFVQSFQSGSIAAKEGEDGRYTVTLEHGLGQTIHFSDRPNRIVGAMPTEDFLATLGFMPNNPPNAALVVDQGDGETDFAVVELFNPVYDPAGPGVTYDVQVLAEWEQTVDMAFAETTTDLAVLAPSFGSAHLFIDGIADCPDGNIQCVTDVDDPHNTTVAYIPNDAHDGFCYSWGNFGCYPCQPWDEFLPNVAGFYAQRAYWDDQCNQWFPACGGACMVKKWCTSGLGEQCWGSM